MPSELGPGVIKVTVRASVKTPKAVVNCFWKAAPSVTGVGSVKVIIVVPLIKPVLSVIIVVTLSGAPGVMVVAVVTSPVLAVKVPNGTKLNVVAIGTARAGVAPSRATAAAASAVATISFQLSLMTKLPLRAGF